MATGVALIALGLVIGRADVVVIGIPLLLSVAWAYSRTPGTPARLTLSPTRHRPEQLEVAQDIEITPSSGVETVRLRVSAAGYQDLEVLVDARRERVIPVAAKTVRTGYQRMFRVDYLSATAESLLRSTSAYVGPESVLLLPSTSALHEVPLPFQLHGLAGAHPSRRPGEGGDFRDVALFNPGDRLRRIDWLTTARRGISTGSPVPELYVRRTFATADAHVMLVVDPGDSLGPDVSTWSGGGSRPDVATSLDIARHAAATMARRYLEQGDRVGLVDLGRSRRSLPPAGGRRHLHRLVHHLAVAEPSGETRRHLRAPQIPSGVLVVVFSSFLDDNPVDMARLWRHHGHRVLAVDVLPRPVTAFLSPEGQLAYRMVTMDRRDRLNLLAMNGVEVVTWLEGDVARDDDVPAARLAALARTRRSR